MAALDNASDGELEAEKPLLPARIIPSTYTAEGDLGGGGIPYGWTFETLIGKGTIRERGRVERVRRIEANLAEMPERVAKYKKELRESKPKSAIDRIFLGS